MRLVIMMMFVGFCSFAQNPCEFSANEKDSLGSYKSTRDYLVYERNFAGASANLYLSLVLTDGMPILNAQMIQKSKDFIKANCLDKNSRMYLQLNNGKVITLMHIDQDNCGTSVRNGNEFNHRVLSGFFMFMKDTMEELKKSPVSIMRIKYGAETIDYIIKPQIISEVDKKTYRPENYFIDTLHCLDN